MDNWTDKIFCPNEQAFIKYYLEEISLNDKKEAGFIYLIDFGDGKTKIGITQNDPRKRMRALWRPGTLMPFDLSLVALGYSAEFSSFIEKYLHAYYCHLRVKGEWYDFGGRERRAFKLRLIEDLSHLADNFCFCEGWWNWKPSDDFIRKYAECPDQDNIVDILENNKGRGREQIEKWWKELDTIE